MSKVYLSSLSAVNSIPLQTPAQQIQRDLDAWLEQGNQIKQPAPAANHDYARGKLPVCGTAAYRVLQMLEADTLAQPRDFNGTMLPTLQIKQGIKWLKEHGWQIKRIDFDRYTGYRLVRERE